MWIITVSINEGYFFFEKQQQAGSPSEKKSIFLL
jgi:hypothetical protein